MWQLPLANSEAWGEDEMFLLIGCSVATLFAAWWLWTCFSAVPSLGQRPAVRGPLLAAVGASFSFLFFVTWSWTAVEIRGGQDYTWLAMAMGGAWFLIYARLFRWLGVGLREDACERTNRAAMIALGGAIPGGMLLYCGAICGEGPSFWNNVFTVLVAGAGWFALWLGLELFSGISRSVAEERDPAAGLRLAGFLLATGLVLGRAAAGNWISMEATVDDLLNDGWICGPLLVGAVMQERLLRPRGLLSDAPGAASGPLVGSVYVLLGLAWVWHLGWWEGAPV